MRPRLTAQATPLLQPIIDGASSGVAVVHHRVLVWRDIAARLGDHCARLPLPTETAKLPARPPSDLAIEEPGLRHSFPVSRRRPLQLKILA